MPHLSFIQLHTGRDVFIYKLLSKSILGKLIYEVVQKICLGKPHLGQITDKSSFVLILRPDVTDVAFCITLDSGFIHLIFRSLAF